MDVNLGTVLLLVLLKVRLIVSDGEIARKSDVDFINSIQNLWMADFNYLSNASDEDLRTLLGKKFTPWKIFRELPVKDIRHYSGELTVDGYSKRPIPPSSPNLPDSYDLRKAWPRCTVMSDIRDQSTCGSCWAVATATVYSNRVCVATRGRVNRHFSGEDILRCCLECKDSTGNGCNGGDIVKAWYFLNRTGVVSGGEYGSNRGCMPYSFPPCEEGSYGDCSKNDAHSKECASRCSNQRYFKKYKFDKRFATEPYTVPEDDNAIKSEIIQHGSVLVPFHVYRDFINYRKGVYFHISGSYVGPHAATLLGWGVTERNQPYWLAANSWGTKWGQNGTFRIHQRYNRCSFGEIIIGSIPTV